MNKEERKKKEVEFKKGIIIDAAKIIFKKKGICGATISEIAREAGFAKGSFYLYFMSKDDIISAIILENDHDLYQIIKEISDQAISASDKIYQFSFAFHSTRIEMIEKYQLDLFANNFLGIDKFLSNEYLLEAGEIKDKIDKIFSETIKQGQEEGVFNQALEPTVITQIIHSFMNGLVVKLPGCLQEYILNKKISIEEFRVERDKFLQIAFDLIMAGLTNKEFVSNNILKLK